MKEIIKKIMELNKQIKNWTLTAQEWEWNGVELECSICHKIIWISDKYYITFEWKNVWESLCKKCWDRLNAPKTNI